MAEQRPATALKDIVIMRMSEHDLLEVVEIEEQSGLSRWGWAAYYAELQSGNRELMLVARPTRSAIVESGPIDRKSTRLNSSHPSISYAVFCLKKKICNTIYTST